MTKQSITPEAFIAWRKRKVERDRESGRPRKFKDIGQRGSQFWRIQAGTYMIQPGYIDKVLSLERFKRAGYEGKLAAKASRPDGEIQHRFGYFVRTGDGTWRWGQYSPMIPEDSLLPFLELARRENTILD
jgi:hypothetical protein